MYTYIGRLGLAHGIRLPGDGEDLALRVDAGDARLLLD